MKSDVEDAMRTATDFCKVINASRDDHAFAGRANADDRGVMTVEWAASRFVVSPGLVKYGPRENFRMAVEYVFRLYSVANPREVLRLYLTPYGNATIGEFRTPGANTDGHQNLDTSSTNARLAGQIHSAVAEGVNASDFFDHTPPVTQ